MKWFAPTRRALVACLLIALALVSACGTLDVAVETADANLGATTVAPNGASATISPPVEEPNPIGPAIAWYGTIHSIPGDDGQADYLKLWHLAIWPKFGRAVGVAGADPVIEAEIERLRDQDIKATFWGQLACNVADYGACRLLVERVSADDGGPQYEPDPIEGWVGRIGRLPLQPGNQDELLYFVLDDPVPALYGIASDDPAIQAELARLAGRTSQTEGGSEIRIWGELGHKAQPVTGALIEVARLEVVEP